MKKEQEMLFSLLKEIDDICTRHGITYYLAPRLALHAANGGFMPENPLSGGILMKISEMENFRKAIEEETPADRALESMCNNPRFPGFFMRYEATNTVCLRLNQGRNFQYPGIGVDIYPLRGKLQSRKEHLRNWKLETGWQQCCEDRSEEEGWREKLCKIRVGIMFAAGRARAGKYLYGKFCRTLDVADTSEYMVRLKNNTVSYPAEIFDKTQKVVLEGTEFTVPADLKLYLSRWFGTGYKNRLKEVYIPSLTMMMSPRISCNEFLEVFGSQDDLVRERNRQYRKDEKGRKCREYLDWSWEYVKLKGEGMNLGQKYLKKKAYLVNLYQNRDYLRFSAEMKEYGQMMKKYLNNEEIFSPDPELTEMYLDLLEVMGNEKLRQKIKKYL